MIMDERNNSEKLLRYCHENIVPKHDEISDCYIHILPEVVWITFEIIFKLKIKLNGDDFMKMGESISSQIYGFCKTAGIEPKFIVILSEY